MSDEARPRIVFNDDEEQAIKEAAKTGPFPL